MTTGLLPEALNGASIHPPDSCSGVLGIVECILFLAELPEAMRDGAKVLEALRLLLRFKFKRTATALQFFSCGRDGGHSCDLRLQVKAAQE